MGSVRQASGRASGRQTPGVVRWGRGVVVACHPLPTAAVTAFATVLAASVGVDRAQYLLLAAAVLTGQLSVGWSNDAVDAKRDARAGRSDKPVVRGEVAATTLWVLAVAVALACVPLSLALGPRPGGLHLLAVAAAWSYNLGLKSTVVSVVPYALAFGLAPAVAVGCLPGSPWPRPGLMLAAALLGSAAHFSNTLGDVTADRATGVRGLPQRCGPVWSARLSSGLVAAAALVFVVAAGGRPAAVASGLVSLGLGATGLVVGGRELAPGDRTPFRLTIAASAVLVVGFVVAGSHLVGP